MKARSLRRSDATAYAVGSPSWRAVHRTVVVWTGEPTRSTCACDTGACRVCGVELPAKVEAIYERTTKTVRCVSHDVHPAVDPAVEEVVEPAVVEVVESGSAGASARREFERRKAKREERIRSKHPKLGGLMLAVSD